MSNPTLPSVTIPTPTCRSSSTHRPPYRLSRHLTLSYPTTGRRSQPLPHLFPGLARDTSAVKRRVPRGSILCVNVNASLSNQELRHRLVAMLAREEESRALVLQRQMEIGGTRNENVEKQYVPSNFPMLVVNKKIYRFFQFPHVRRCRCC